MNYPVTYPFSKYLYKIGFTPLFRVNFIQDKEAGVFVATCKDMPGLVVEAETFDQLKSEVTEAINTLLELSELKKDFHSEADIIYKDHIAIA